MDIITSDEYAQAIRIGIIADKSLDLDKLSPADDVFYRIGYTILRDMAYPETVQ